MPFGEGAVDTERDTTLPRPRVPVPCFGPGPIVLGTVYGPGPGVPVSVLEQGYPSIPKLCTGSRSTPRQGLPGDRQGPPWFLWSHSRTKCLSQGDKAPARGACREGQPRHLKELATTRHASRRGPVSDKLPDATRQRPRQGACRGKLPLCTRAPTHPPTCHPGAFPGARGKRLCG